VVLPEGQSGSATPDKLGKKSNYRELLKALQFRCTWHRDVPFTVSLTATHISISWDEKVEPLKRKTIPAGVLALDLNPNRIGAAVLERRVKPAALSGRL